MNTKPANERKKLREFLWGLTENPGVSSAAWTSFLWLQKQLQKYFDAGYDAVAYQEKILNYISKNHEPLLQVGAGMGIFSALLAFHQKRFFTVDQQASKLWDVAGLLQIVNKKEMGILVQAPAVSLPFKNNTFKFVCSIHTLHHFFDPWATIAEMERVADERGTIIIADLNRDGLKLMKEIKESLGHAHNISGLSMFQVAEYFDNRSKYVHCVRDVLQTTLLVTSEFRKY